LKLKKLVKFFMHPEEKLKIDATACARSFFGRPSAPQTTDEEEEERTMIFAEMQAMREMASAYQHPEAPLEIAATACVRNYFSQPWASEQETFGLAEERALALKQAKKLGDAAKTYQHPEAPLGTMDATAFGRNYFGRASAPDTEDAERSQILEEMQAMKKLAVDYMHPEIPIKAADGAVFGRNYFARASAQEQEEDEYTDDRAIILEEMAELKQAAVDFRHPEVPLAMDASLFGRSYYGRASSEEQDSDDVDPEEQARVMADCARLKGLAVDFMHPERELSVDPSVFGRNYYGRASADEQVDSDDIERELVLQDSAALYRKAVDYMHPEASLQVDPAVFGRNYYGRASAEDKESFAAAEQRAHIIAEAAKLKDLASTYRHPEAPLVCDVAGRNFFTRVSAPEYDSDDEFDADELARILEEAAQLKKLAVDYAHPERPLEVDSAACGRNYFNRFSAPHEELDDHREAIFADLAALYKTAVDYLHPEREVTVDSTLFGRNYFGRASAPEQETFGQAEAREHAIAEAKALKKAAHTYLHPEVPLATDSVAFGRNYFSRASAVEETPEEAEEREHILGEAAKLKKLAVDYLHPEEEVATDATACARSFFSRPSAPEADTFEEANERAHVLAEASSLMKLAVDYHHPELSLKATDATVFGRNYFTRPSAVGAAENIHSYAAGDQPSVQHVEEEEHSHHDDYGHFDMDEELFYDMRQTLVVPGASYYYEPKFQGTKISSDEEGDLSRSPSTVMLFTGALDEDAHPPLLTLG